jgi:hypothetical protein
MNTSSKDVIIKGVTTGGKIFRPSDWAERLSSAVATFGADNRMNYSPYVQPVTRDGVRCVAVNAAYEQVAPQAYRFLMDFARDNDLVIESASAEIAHAA